MYSRRRKGVNAAATALACVAFGFTNPLPSCEPAPALACEPAPALAQLFTPPHPQLGRYEVCTAARPLTEAAPRGWAVESVGPLDAFGAAGTYDRSAVARLYKGQLASVARGWFRDGDHVESVTFISPYPDATVSRLVPGTLIIRLIICCT